MRTRIPPFWFLFALFLLLTVAPAVSGWSLQNWSATPAGSEYAPGTSITTVYSMHFDSWMSGSTFESDNALVMYTDLSSPHWTVTKTETLEGQDPIVEGIPVRQGSTARLDGWSLSYVRKRFDLAVQLTGKTPALNQSGDFYIIKLQEVAPGAKAVSGTLIEKKAHVVIPTPVPTASPELTVETTPDEIIVVTPEITLTEAKTSPTLKGTYAPGPEPVSIIAVLACLFLMARSVLRKE